MIELCHESDNWEDITEDILNENEEHLRFELYKLRFGGVVYTENTPAFCEAFQKQVMWERLSD